jgi:hypothetical protein
VNLSSAAVHPDNATYKTIVWTVKEAGTTGVTNADLADKRFTPTGAGNLVLTATIAGGGAGVAENAKQLERGGGNMRCRDVPRLFDVFLIEVLYPSPRTRLFQPSILTVTVER